MPKNPKNKSGDTSKWASPLLLYELMTQRYFAYISKLQVAELCAAAL